MKEAGSNKVVNDPPSDGLLGIASDFARVCIFMACVENGLHPKGRWIGGAKKQLRQESEKP